MTTSFILSPVSPFRLDYTVWALRRREKNIIDRWDGKHYTRLFSINNRLIKIMIEQKNQKIFIKTDKNITKSIQKQLSNRLELMLGLKCNLKKFYAMTRNDSRLKPLAIKFMGLKPPRFPSIFEALVNAVSCQQISLDAGLQIQNRLVQYVGLQLKENEQLFYAFPRPIDVANCNISNLKKIGYSTHKSETLIQLASKIAEDESSIHNLEKKSNEEILNFLYQFKGVGRWSAEYVLLRGLGRIEIFPGDDVGANKNLQELLNINKKLNYEHTLTITKKWYPYAGFIYFLLLLLKLKRNQKFQLLK